MFVVSVGIVPSKEKDGRPDYGDNVQNTPVAQPFVQRQNYLSPDGKFSIAFPGTPQYSSQNVTKSGALNMFQAQQYSFKDKLGTEYSVWSDPRYSGPNTAAGLKEYYVKQTRASLTTGVLNNIPTGVQMISEKTGLVNGIPTLDYLRSDSSARDSKKKWYTLMTRGRYYLSDGVIYDVRVSCDSKVCDDAVNIAFLDSFSFVN
jgi:hypothetical protein